MYRPRFSMITLIITFALLVQACHLFRTEARFQIKVIDAAGYPLADAAVVIQKETLARTNAQGLASITTQLPYDAPILLEINKTSTHLFYAPFFETVRVKRGEANTFKVEATLFAVSTVNPTPTPSEPAPEKPESVAALGPDEKAPMPESGENPTEAALPLLSEATPPDTGSIPSEVQPMPEIDGLTPDAFDPEIETQKALESLNGSYSQQGLLTFYVSSGSELVGNATILYGNKEQNQWMDGCTTNARGRCTMTIDSAHTHDALHLLVRAPRYQAQSKIISLAQGDRFRIELDKGESFEVFTVLKRYQSSRGLAGVKIKLEGREIGETDRFGYFASPLNPSLSQGKVELEAPGHIPSRIQFELPKAGPLTRVQHYQTASAPRPRGFLLPLIISGSEAEAAAWERELSEGLRHQVLTQAPFDESDIEKLGPLLNRFDISPLKMARNGWQNAEINQEIDFLLRPLLLLQSPPVLELSIIDQNGDVRAAAQSQLPLQPDPRQIKSVLIKLRSSLAENFPFEGALVEELKDGFRINLSHQEAHALKVGEELTLWGIGTEGSARQQSWGELGLARIVSTSDAATKVQIDRLSPQAVAALGQTVVMSRGKPTPKNASITLELKDSVDQKPLKQVNVYFQKKWLGASDSHGLLRVPSALLQKRGQLEILRTAYMAYREDLVPGTRQEWIFSLRRQAFPIRIHSRPPQALVKLNGRVLGRTPLHISVEIPLTEAQLEVSADATYLPYTKVLAVDEEGMDFTGENTINLEQDIRHEARQLVTQQRIPEAIALLESIPESHGLFPLAQHEIGELLLNRLHEPVKAATAFHKVTSRPEIASFADKRFIGTHINEGMALFHAGEAIVASEPKTALSYWQKAAAVIELCEPQLRFVPQDRYTQALHNVLYYRALSLHRAWSITQNGNDLEIAHQAWKNYIQNTALTSPSDRNYASLKKAEAFYRHTESLLQGNKQALFDKRPEGETSL